MTARIIENSLWEYIQKDWQKIHNVLESLGDFKEVEEETFKEIPHIKEALFKLNDVSFYPKDKSFKAANVALYTTVASKILEEIVHKQDVIVLSKKRKKRLHITKVIFLLFSSALGAFALIFSLPKCFLSAVIFLICQLLLSPFFNEKFMHSTCEKEMQANIIKSASYYSKYSRNVLKCLSNRIYLSKRRKI